ncbi:MAM and LDL-receptor class A domain-containing protein 1-like [Antedon mediterranea]|uniref:MAM and LDL-receptor class A domain-containing protein 1-like n=1 Tax=Antedon mediterranea TaxID=105859 RepID=UPI003AF5B34F
MVSILKYCILLLMISSSYSLFCDFETDFCNFEVDTDDELARFLRWSKSTGRFVSYIPLTDHTYGNGTGRYAFMKTRYSVYDGHLYSPELTNTGYKCMSFYYQVTGQVNEVKLSVLALYNDTDTGTAIWTLNGGRGRVWRQVEVPIPEGVYKLAFKGHQTTTSQGISIDDVNVTTTECSKPENKTEYVGIRCDFESFEICGYKQDNSDDMDWVWSSGTTYTSGTGPSKDHTRTDQFGFYMYLETSVYPVVSGHKARLISPSMNKTTDNCLEFWYNMHGRHSERLNVFVKESKSESLGSADWTKAGDHGDKWYRGTVTVDTNFKSFYVVFEAVRGEGDYGDIALDDVFIHEGKCPEIPTPAPPRPIADVSCTFEVDMCNYTQGIGDKFDWARYTGDGYRSYVLPRVDHTLGTDKGAFVNINPLYSNTIGDDARLVTPLIKMNKETMCLRFYFYINHWSVDKFAVYVVLKGDSMPIDPFWAIYNQRSSTWQSQDLEIYPQDSDFYIMFVGTKGSSTYPNIALDDVSTTSGVCKVITPTPGVPDADCDFEKNMTVCGYEQDTTDNFDWVWHKGSTGSDNTGPAIDHTKGDASGHYIYIETSDPRRPNQRAKITSQTIAGRDEPICLHFWYHMKGEHVGTLNVYKIYTGSTYRRSIWTRNGNQGKNWKEASVLINQDYEGSGTFDIVDLSFKVSFEAIVGDGHEGDIAIDDIKFEVGSCKPEAPEEPPITKSCDFESGLEKCGMYQAIGDEFDWISMNKSVQSNYKKYKPYIKNHGNIMALDMAGKKPHTRAVIIGFIAVKPNAQYCMSLEYVITGDITQRINVVMYKSNSYYGPGVSKPLKSIVGHNDDVWKKAYININPNGKNVTYGIEGVVGVTDKGQIAIDNIKIDEMSCSKIKPEKEEEGSNFGMGIGIGFLICVLIFGCILVAAYLFYNRRQGLPRYTKELNTNAIFKGGEHDPDINFS